MFKKALDEKSIFVTSEGDYVVDITESMFLNISDSMNPLCSFYKVSKDMTMRVDKVSSAIYGSVDYADVIMKYSNIDNPFAIEEGDVITAPSLSNVYFNIKEANQHPNGAGGQEGSSTYELIKNYHKYIDKSKVPTRNGSEANNLSVPSTANNVINDLSSSNSNSFYGSDGTMTEPNLANRGKSGVTVVNGRVYFGNNVSASTSDVIDVDGTNDTNSNLVDCAKNGVTLGQFLNATIKNTIK